MGRCYFLVSEQESNQRTQPKGALRANRAPLGNPPAAIPKHCAKRYCRELNFWQKIGTFSAKTASRLRCSSAYGDAAGGYIRGRLWRAGARHTGPLMSATFRPFLAETRKGQHSFRQINDHLSKIQILSLYSENFPLLLGTLMLLSKCWLRPDDIAMPLAQLREKAVCAVHHPPLLGYRVIILKGGYFP